MSTDYAPSYPKLDAGASRKADRREPGVHRLVEDEAGRAGMGGDAWRAHVWRQFLAPFAPMLFQKEAT